MKTKPWMRIGSIAILLFSSFAAQAQSSKRPEILKQIETLRSQLKVLEDSYLSPSEQELAAYASLLRQPDTGLIRLLPREKYDNPDKLTIRGGGAYYSFSHLTHEYGYGSDIELQGNQLSVGFAGADFGMIARIESTSLEKLTLGSSGVAFLSGYVPPNEIQKARSEFRRFSEGVRDAGTVYRSRVPLAVGATYVLRSINYHSSDVLVGLHVVSTDDDGSAVIAWKMLKKYPVPSLD
ncbi:MAG: hypothetical protein LAO31_02180 [Acidobacteriia bacterium]|nr:hypothetical protein [Terriglobia bacterium]